MNNVTKRLHKQVALLCLSCALCFFPSLAGAASPSEPPNVALTIGNGNDIVILSISSEPEQVHSFTLSSPDRYVLDLYPATLQKKGLLSLDSPHPGIRGIRAARHTSQTVRVVLDLHQPEDFLTLAKPQTCEKSTYDIVIMYSPQKTDEPSPSKQALNSTSLQPTAVSRGPATATSEPQPASSQSEPSILLFSADPTTHIAASETKPSLLPDSLELGGFVELKAALNTRRANSSQIPQTFRNRIRLEGKWSPGATPEDMFQQVGDHDVFLLASVQSDYLRFKSNQTTSDSDLELFEAYMHWSRNPWEVRLGRQRIRWGKTDEVSPVDNLNPEDLREFLLPDREDRKIPNWMARVRYFSEKMTLEGVFIPFFEPSRFAYFGTDWSLLQGIEDLVTAPTPAVSPHPLYQQPAVLEQTPHRRFTNGDWGLRVSKTRGNMDMAASYLYAWQKLPHIQGFTPDAMEIFERNGVLSQSSSFQAWNHPAALAATFRRINIVGLELETTLAQFGLRGEAAYFDRKTLHTINLDSTEKPVLQYVLGVDYLSANEWYLNIQFGHQVIFQHDQDLLFWEKNDFSVNGEISRAFWRGNFETVFRYHYNLVDDAYLLRPFIVVRPDGNWEFTLGADLVEGPKSSILGRFRDNDRFYVNIKYIF